MKTKVEAIREAVLAMHRLLEQLVALQTVDRQCCRACVLPVNGTPDENADSAAENSAVDEPKIHYDEEELMTIKEAQDHFSRTKLYELRKEGKLITIEHGARDKRLVRAQVEALAKKWRR